MSIFYTKKDALQFKSSNKYLFGFDKDTTSKKIFELTTYQKLYKKIITKPCHYYEYYENDQPIKLFFDIDQPITIHSSYTIDSLIQTTLNIIQPYITNQDQSTIILNASTPTKNSLHIIFPNIIFPNISNMNQFVKQIKQETNHVYFDKKIIDTSIYAPRCFRIMHCSKFDKNNTLILHSTHNYKQINDYQLFLDTLLLHNTESITFTFISPPISHIPSPSPITPHLPIKCINTLENDCIIFELVNILSIERLNDRTAWINLGILLYCLNQPLQIWNIISSKSNKYQPNECYQLWQTFYNYPKKYSIATLHYWSKEDNHNEYYNIIKKYNKLSVSTSAITNDINTRYLLDENKKIIPSLSQHIKDFISTKQILNIKSPYGTGKTQLLISLIKKLKPKRVLWLSYRRTLTADILHNFPEFTSYKIDPNANKVIIQIESLCKINLSHDDSVPTYDLIIGDEIESILNQFSSSTFKNNARNTFDYMSAIISTSLINNGKFITLDGDLSDRTYTFTNFFGESTNIINQFIPEKGNLNIHINRENFTNILYHKLDLNKKVVIISMTEKDVLYYTSLLKDKYPKKRIAHYTSKTDDIKKNDLNNVNDTWTKYDIILYSPTIEGGVNFSEKHFDSIFGIISSNSTSPRAFYQMLARIRHCTDSDIEILNSSNMKLNNCIYQTFDQTKKQLIECQDINLSKEYITTNNICTSKTVINNFDIIYIHNKVEEKNKQKYCFLSLFSEMATQKGYKIEHITESISKQIPNKTNIIEKLLSTLDIDNNEYEHLLLKQTKEIATMEEKYQIEKKSLKNKLCVELLNEPILKAYYKNTEVINKFASLIDIRNLKLTDTLDDNINIKRIECVNKLINNMGYDNLFDEKIIPKEQIEERIIKHPLINNKLLFPNSKATSFKARIGYINGIIKGYGLKLNRIRKHNRKPHNTLLNYYKIEFINGINDITKLRIKKGYKFYDNCSYLLIDNKLKDPNIKTWNDLTHDPDI